jgi:hypothetical protein
VFSTSDRYRVIVRGECGPLLAAAFENAVIEPGDGVTSIIAVVQDDSALYGLLDQIQNLALHLVSVNEIVHSEPRTAAARRLEVPESEDRAATGDDVPVTAN